MFEFVKIHDNRTNLDYNWVYFVTNTLQLTFIHEITTQNRVVNSFHNENPDKDNILTQLYASKINNSEAIAACKLIDDSYKRKEKYLNLYSHILINKDGGFFFLTENMTITEKLSKQTIEFPQLSKKDIRIVKYPQGRHFYAFVGIHEVKIDDEIKWNTHNYAFEMAEKFLQNLYK